MPGNSDENKRRVTSYHKDIIKTKAKKIYLQTMFNTKRGKVGVAGVSILFPNLGIQ